MLKIHHLHLPTPPYCPSDPPVVLFPTLHGKFFILFVSFHFYCVRNKKRASLKWIRDEVDDERGKKSYNGPQICCLACLVYARDLLAQFRVSLNHLFFVFFETSKSGTENNNYTNWNFIFMVLWTVSDIRLFGQTKEAQHGKCSFIFNLIL